VTLDELQPVIAQYRAGLEAEMSLLRRLRGLAHAEQQEAAAPGEALIAIVDQRETVMATLVSVESQLKPLREILVANREPLAEVPEFLAVSALHQDAAALVASIVGADHESQAALKQAEITRKLAADAVEKGENTLAAYRRVVTPRLAQATLVNRRG
jgi:hypothetical protein